jgi:solute carrier family 25 (mitochondrial thiamine pyrophosphate transporter), member 19
MGISARSSGDDKAQQWVHAAAGGLAGAVSRLVVGPLDVVKIRMQVQLEPIRQGANSKYYGVVQALSTIVREEGIQVRSTKVSERFLHTWPPK